MQPTTSVVENEGTLGDAHGAVDVLFPKPVATGLVMHVQLRRRGSAGNDQLDGECRAVPAVVEMNELRKRCKRFSCATDSHGRSATLLFGKDEVVLKVLLPACVCVCVCTHAMPCTRMLLAHALCVRLRCPV